MAASMQGSLLRRTRIGIGWPLASATWRIASSMPS
jgi:hypothetical protein